MRKHTFNNLIGILFLLSSVKSGSFGVEADEEKGGSYLMVVTCDVIKGFLLSSSVSEVRTM